MGGAHRWFIVKQTRKTLKCRIQTRTTQIRILRANSMTKKKSMAAKTNTEPTGSGAKTETQRRT
jgi:hypothetical protein